jgi:hypothetical protein
VPFEYSLNLAELYSVAADLDLLVGAADEGERTVGKAAR